VLKKALAEAYNNFLKTLDKYTLEDLIKNNRSNLRSLLKIA